MGELAVYLFVTVVAFALVLAVLGLAEGVAVVALRWLGW